MIKKELKILIWINNNIKIILEKNMIDFKKNPKLGIFIYGLLLISCLLEIMVELGIHEFDDFASHHGLAIFAFGSLFANWDELTGAVKHYKNKKSEK